MPLTRDDDIRELLTSARTIAVFGCSDRPDRPSYGVSAFLQRTATGCFRSIRRSRASVCMASSSGATSARSECRSTSSTSSAADRGRRSGRPGDRGGRQGRLDAARHRQRGSGGPGGSCRPQGGDGPLHQDRDHAARDTGNRNGLSRAYVISGTRSVGESTPRRNSRSVPGSSVANMSSRFDAIVISCTGSEIAPFRTMKPAAPRL